MLHEREISCTVSGSFKKFKPEIDRTIDEFRDHGVNVLAPAKGWLYIPPVRQYSKKDLKFRPLPSERHMTIRQIEDEFLRCIVRSTFLYVVNPEGYIGISVAFEMGVAFSSGIPIYSRDPVPEDIDSTPISLAIISSIKVLPPEETVKDIKDNRQIKTDLVIP